MDTRQFAARLSERTGNSPREAAAMIELLGAIIAANCSDLDTIAIPGFGTFTASKHDEYIVEDTETGRRMLYPPAIVTEFRPSVILRHRLEK